jgi:hypothetical protein
VQPLEQPEAELYYVLGSPVFGGSTTGPFGLVLIPDLSVAGETEDLTLRLVNAAGQTVGERAIPLRAGWESQVAIGPRSRDGR